MTVLCIFIVIFITLMLVVVYRHRTIQNKTNNIAVNLIKYLSRLALHNNLDRGHFEVQEYMSSKIDCRSDNINRGVFAEKNMEYEFIE